MNSRVALRIELVGRPAAVNPVAVKHEVVRADTLLARSTVGVQSSYVDADAVRCGDVVAGDLHVVSIDAEVVGLGVGVGDVAETAEVQGGDDYVVSCNHHLAGEVGPAAWRAAEDNGIADFAALVDCDELVESLPGSEAA